jgi:hypothetical protein
MEALSMTKNIVYLENIDRCSKHIRENRLQRITERK